MDWKHLLHTGIWQRVPREVRRSGLFLVTSQLAPRLTKTAEAKAPFIVAGVLRTASGLGEGARLCYDALSRCGYDVFGIDLTARFRQPGPLVDFRFRDGSALDGAGTLILHINSPYVPFALMCLGRRFIKRKRIIGYWAWELPVAPPEWRFGLPFVHEIWVPSRFTASAVAAIAGEVPVSVVAHPVAVRGRAAALSSGPRDSFTALVAFNMASSFARKNPLAAIQAFTQAFDSDPDCQLTLRVINADLYPKGYAALSVAIASLANVRMSEMNSGRVSVEDMYADADVVISLHRSEGFGLVIAEAMLRGLPVVATNWSGNVDFLTPENGMPVPYALIPATDPQGTFEHPSQTWADADVQDAAVKLRMLRDDPKMRAALSRRAVLDATSMFGVEQYTRTVGKRLEVSHN